MGANITDAQFLYIDIVALVPLSIFQAWTGAYHKLTKDMPTETLFYYPIILSVVVSAVIQCAFQVFFYENIKKQPFYEPYEISDLTFSTTPPTDESTVLFFLANF